MHLKICFSSLHGCHFFGQGLAVTAPEAQWYVEGHT